MALEGLSLRVEMEGHRPCAKKQQNLVPGARHGPNVCRFVSSGWPRHESEANLSGLDPGTFGRRLALGGCRVARLAGIEDCDECVYRGDQAN
jgi:hypothetical protein